MRPVMLILIALAVGTVSPPATGSEAPAGAERFAPVGELAGRCWVGRLGEGKGRDVQCFDWAIDGRFLRNRHRLTGPGGVYQGETLYGWDPGQGVLRYWYFTSLGGVSEGTVERQGEGWVFRERYRGSEGEMELRTAFSRDGDDAFSVDTRVLREGRWEPFGAVRFEAFGRRAAETGGPWAGSADLAFNSERDGSYDVVFRDLASGEERALTAEPTTEWVYAAGERLAIVSDRAAGAEKGYRLYLLDPRTGELERLTDFPVADSWIGFLPGGAGYVVCADKDGDTELFQLDAKGAIVRQLTDNDAGDCQPDVTPDGRTVVFWSDRGGSAEIWAMGLDGSSPRQLTRFAGNDRVSRHRYGGEGPPRVSPDGTRIAWMSIRGGEDWDVYTMDLDGGDVRRLTDHLADDAYPAWSPDGRYLAFDSDRYGSHDVFVVPAEGGDVRRLTDHPAREQAPVWVAREPEDPR